MKAIDGTRKSMTMKKAIIIVFWAVLIIFCFIYRDRISIESIIDFTPKNTILAVVVMLLLFALKGVAIFIYGSILYIVSGMIFPLPLAIAVNTVGTVIMTGIPYYIGKKGGKRMVEDIVKRHPKLTVITDYQKKNELFLCFFIRIVGMLPADIVAMYLGASGIGTKNYFLGTVTGLFSAILCFSVMGTAVDDPMSPQFLISLAAEIILALISIIIYIVINKRKKTE